MLNQRGRLDEDVKQHMLMEEKLDNEGIAMRHQGKPVKRWWFVRRGRQTLDELEPDHNFLLLNLWFERFQNRHTRFVCLFVCLFFFLRERERERERNTFSKAGSMFLKIYSI